MLDISTPAIAKLSVTASAVEPKYFAVANISVRVSLDATTFLLEASAIPVIVALTSFASPPNRTKSATLSETAVENSKYLVLVSPKERLISLIPSCILPILPSRSADSPTSFFKNSVPPIFSSAIYGTFNINRVF